MNSIAAEAQSYSQRPRDGRTRFVFLTFGTVKILDVNLRPGCLFLNRVYIFSDMKKREDLGQKREAVNLHKLVTGVLQSIRSSNSKCNCNSMVDGIGPVVCWM